ncbi:MAG: esterase [Pseudomonadales bacterium]|nr:esterase [Pseudomonadales bacterium]
MYQEIDVEQSRGRSPSVWHAATELPRVVFEFSSLLYTWPLLGTAPRGDGHPVLVLPGFTAGDESTVMLRRYLGRLGYTPLPWGLGRNTGSFALQEQLFERFRALAGGDPRRISIIGQSLGGVFARELARQFPDRVRFAITLGSPFSSEGPESANGAVARLFQYMSGMTREQMRDQMLRYPAEAPPVPCSAVYSKSDGVVHWSSCLEYPGTEAENIEVVASHTGMAMNPVVYHIIADRLAQPEGRWKPFDRSRGWRALVYPQPERKTAKVPACAN